jgi:lipoate-protein ligase A
MSVWRLLDTPPMTAAENMALDDTLLELKGQGKSPNTIHFLQFSPKAVLLGYHQSVKEEVRREFCESQGIHINRRITGGGAIFFDESQLGWEVICDKTFFNANIPNTKLFKKLCDPVIMALNMLGLKSDFRPRNDIEIYGRKISGTGGTESEGAFLFQGTMLTDFDVETMVRSLRIPVEKLKAKELDSVKERVTCLKWELGCNPPLEEVKKVIRTGFETCFKIQLEPDGLTDSEKRLFDQRLEYYSSEKWINQIAPKFKTREVVQAAYKSEAGLIRFTIVVNLPQMKIKDLYITGDFLSFPSRALYDMECMLRGVPLDREVIYQRVRAFFDEGRISIPEMSFEDFIKPVDQILEKVAITKYGLKLEDCNLISVTNGSFEEILRKGPSVLLLPYCSKLLTCKLRYEKACQACGDCTIGDAWTLGRRKKMKPVCVVSFGDLTDELRRMKEAGVSAFIGCCCQPFFIKHLNDFREAGLPGILLDIDSTTCYELDQVREAYAGQFTSQTSINLDLLDAVLNAPVG